MNGPLCLRASNRENQSLKIGFGLLLVMLLINTQLVRAELFIHQLKNQPAQNIIPAIQPHLSKQTSISANGFQLLVDGIPQDNQKVISLLQILDSKLRQYFVEVKILNQQMQQHQLSSSKMAIDNKSTQVKLNRFQAQGYQSNGDNFSLRTTENYQALVNTGESFPSNLAISQYGHLLPSSGRTNINSGFYITVQQTSPQTVSLSVSAQQQNRQVNNSRSIDSSSASTRVVGDLGKWILVASNAKRSSLGNSKRYTTNSKASKQRWYYVRVNAVLDE